MLFPKTKKNDILINTLNLIFKRTAITSRVLLDKHNGSEVNSARKASLIVVKKRISSGYSLLKYNA